MGKADKGHKKRLILVAKGCFAIVLLLWVGSKQDWQSLKTSLLHINFFVFAAGVIGFIISQFFVAIRWCMLLWTQNVQIGFKALIKLHFLGLFYNNFLPSSVGGDFLRAWYITKHTDRRLEAALSVFVDRVIGLIALTLMAIVGYVLLEKSGQWNFMATGGENGQQQTKDFYKMVIGGAIVLGVLAIGASLTLLHPFGRKYAAKLFGYVKSRLLRILTAIKIYITKPFIFIAALLITAFGQIICITGFWLIGESIGVGVSAKYYFVFFPIVWVVGVVPISIGGIGILEGLLTVLFAQAGGHQEAAFALSLFQRVIFLVGSLPGIFIHLAGGHLPGQEFFVDYKDSLD